MEKTEEKYCSFIIWGNGLKCAREIIDKIRSNKNLEIKKIFFRKPRNIGKFVKLAYSKDYAPYKHLKAKTKYLKKSDPRVIIVFALNKNPKEIFFGKGDFRHIECKLLKKFKEELRDKFNPKDGNGCRTEEHVIHGTDSEHQVDHLLKLLGFKEGIEYLRKKPNPILSAPHHIPSFFNFKIKKIDLSSIYCNIIKGDLETFYLEEHLIEETPHYKFLIGDIHPYEEYLAKFGGYLLTDDYSVEKFKKMAKNFSYLEKPYETSYILVKEFQLNKYLVLDGVHKVCILKFLRKKDAVVAIVK